MENMIDNTRLFPRTFQPLPLGSIRPSGWLWHQLRLQADGLSGHLDEFWPDVADSAWIGGAAEGWERGPYWLDGLVPLAYLLDDDRLREKVIRWLDYIKNLGCTAIWLSPIFKNRREKIDTYHGYGIQDFLEVDRRFGTKEDFQELVRQAHARNMYVILDIIINHTGDNWAYPGDYYYYYWGGAPSPFDFGFWREADPAPGFQEDDAGWPVELQHPDCYKRRGQIRDWSHPDKVLNGDFLTLKELNITRPDVLDTLIKVYKYWIAATDIDGFRVDTVKHVEDTATAIFCNAVREFAKRIGKHN